MLTAHEVGQSILRCVNGEISERKLIALSLHWMLHRRDSPYEPNHETLIAETVLTILAMDEGPEYRLTPDELRSLAEPLIKV